MRLTLPPLLLCALLAALACAEAAPRTPRNLVVVCLDTVRADTFALPDALQRTDSLSPWLESALVFSNAQSTAPWTVPSIASMLTGLYPAAHGAGQFAGPVANLQNEIPSALSPDAATLAESLESAGFRTGAFVAHPWFTSGYGLDRGFGTVALHKGAEKVVSKGLAWLDEAGAAQGATDAAGDSSIRSFLYLHFMEAHDQHREPIAAVREKLADTPLAGSQEQQSSPADLCEKEGNPDCDRYRVYALAVRQLRATVAGLMDELAARDLLSDTIVIIFSDHGEEFSEHRQIEQAAATDPRDIYGVGHGHQLFQELLHVPLIVWHPGMAGRTVAQRTSLVDAVPSVLAWLQIPDGAQAGVEGLDGVELGSLTADSGEERPVFSSGIAYGVEGKAVVKGRWKSIRMVDGREPMLFDLESDPKEEGAADHADIVQVLDGELDSYATPLGRAKASVPDIPEEQMEHLKAIGYLGGADGT